MQTSLFTLADVIGGPVFFAFGATAALAIFLMIVVVEAVVLRVMRYAGFGRSFVDSLVANLVSSLFGIVVLFMGVSQNSILGSVAGWGGAWALSVAIEGGILLLFKRQPPRRIWLLSLVANALSYVLLAIFFKAID